MCVQAQTQAEHDAQLENVANTFESKEASTKASTKASKKRTEGRDLEAAAEDKDELARAIVKVLAVHRAELGGELGELAARKNAFDNSAQGKQRSLPDRVAADLSDLLEEAKVRTNEGAAQDVSGVQSKLAEVEGELNKTVAQRDALKKEIEDLKQKPVAVKDELSKVVTQHEALHAQRDALQREIEELKNSLVEEQMAQGSQKSHLGILGLLLLCVLLFAITNVNLFILA